jgi:hyperosmotically inducible protein
MKLSVMMAVAMLAAGPVAAIAAERSSSAAQAQPSDQELSSLIATRLANDKSLSPDAIKVSVKGGVVTLTGIVPKDADIARAEEGARVTGVVRVDNKLTSREKATGKTKSAAGKVAETTRKGAEKTAEKTKQALSKTGEVITDGWISSRIKTRFMADEALRASAITVDASDKVVTLSGAVPTAAARAKALKIANEVEGVKRVVDKLTVADKTP